MTEIGNMPDDQYERIIEAATLMHRMQYLDEGEELERVDLAFQAALALLYSEAPANIAALVMVQHLLDGKPYSMTSDNPDSIRLYIALAHAIGARVEDGAGPFADVLPTGLCSIRVYPPSQAKH